MVRSRKRRGFWSWLQRGAGFVYGLLVLMLVLGGLALMFPKATFFEPLRAMLAERVLSAALGSSVEIAGPVAFDVGSTFLVTGSEIRVERPEGASEGADRIDHGEVGIDFDALLSDRFDLTVLRLQGVSLARNSSLMDVESTGGDGTPVEVHLIGLLPGVVRLARHAEIAVSDVDYTYRDETNGWIFDVAVAELSNAEREPDGAMTIAANGKVNGTSVRATGEIQSATGGDAAAGDRFVLTMTLPSAHLEVRSLVPDDPVPALQDTSLRARIDSLGDMLETLRLVRSVEGAATLYARIEVAEGLPALRNLDSNVNLENGSSIRITGGIDDLAARKGFDLAVDATWPSGDAPLSEDEGLLTFELREISAKLVGDIGALVMTDGWITTNLFADAMPKLGPITASSVRREDKGTVALEGLHVLAGATDAPALDLTGRIGDLLQLSDFRLEGNVAIPTAELLRIGAEDAPLGQLTGTLALSDASGTAGVDTFTASLSDSSLLSANVNFKHDSSQASGSAVFDLVFNVPDYAKLATALALTAQPVGAVGYEGSLSLTPQSGEFDGRFSFGRTVVIGDLSLKPEGGRPLISGKVASPDLVLADLRRLLTTGQEIAELRVSPASTSDARQPTVLNPRVDVEVSAARIDGGGGEAVSGVNGRFGYDNGLATARSVALRFRQGRFHFDGQMHVRKRHRPFSVKGRLDDWPMGELLKELKFDLPVRGNLKAAFDVSSSGASVHEAIADANGNVYLRITDGVIGNRLLDLTGLVLPSWLFAPSARTGVSKIECFDSKMALVPGRATIQRVVVETDDVIVPATGLIDFKADTINIEAAPKALRPNLIPIVSPFAIRGKLSDPKVTVKGGVVGRAAAETLALPFNTLGTLLGVDRSGPKPRRPRTDC